MVTRGLFSRWWGCQLSPLCLTYAHQSHTLGSCFLPPGSVVKSEMFSKSRAVAAENLLAEVQWCDYFTALWREALGPEVTQQQEQTQPGATCTRTAGNARKKTRDPWHGFVTPTYLQHQSLFLRSPGQCKRSNAATNWFQLLVHYLAAVAVTSWSEETMPTPKGLERE